MICFLVQLAQLRSVLADCYDNKDCKSCAGSSQWFGTIKCYWCPFSKACHAWGSAYNPCVDDIDISEKSKCPAPIDEGSYDPNDAYEYSILSAAAYGKDHKQCVDSVSPKFKVIETIAVRCDNSFSSYDECVAYTAVSTEMQTIAISFRGTAESEQLIDQFMSFLTDPSTSFPSGGKVFEYFSNAYNYLYGCSKGSMQNLLQQYPGYKVVVTGHSLGGALASLTAAALVYDGVVPASNLELYTYGMPRVGDKSYAHGIDRLLTSRWNVVNDRDLVPHLPPCNILGCNGPFDGPFHHMREIFYYGGGDMTVKSPYKICEANEDDLCSNGAIGDDPCFDIKKCVELHRIYFNMNIGSLCKDTLQDSALPKPWTEKLDFQCKTFPFN